MNQIIEYLETDTSTKDDFRPDWSMKCDNCLVDPDCPSHGPVRAVPFRGGRHDPRRMVGRTKGRNEMIVQTFCVKCQGARLHFVDGPPSTGPFECAQCGYRWTVKAGRQIPEVKEKT